METKGFKLNINFDWKEEPAEYYDTTYYVYQYELYDDETGAVTRRNATPHEICQYKQVVLF